MPIPSAGLVAWYRADDVAGIDGAAVGTWPDRTANAYDLTEATNQPTKQTLELNGEPIVRFDGVNDKLGRASTPAINVPYTYVVVAKLTDATDGGVAKHMFGDAGANSVIYHRYASSFTGQIAIFADNELNGTTVPNGSTWYVYEACFNYHWSWLRLGDNRPEIIPTFANYPGDGNSNQSVGLRVGGYPEFSVMFPGDVAEVMVYDRPLRDEDRRDILNEVFSRYAIGAALADTDTTYGNEGGAGYRVGEPYITTTATITGRIFNLLDGAFANDADNAFQFGAESGREIVFDFGVGASKIIDDFKWYQGSSESHGSWNFDGSNNGSSWTTIITGLTLGGGTAQEYTSTNTTGYRYYRLIQTSGTTSATPWCQEIEFKIAKAAGDTATSFHNTGGQGARAALITVSSDDETGAEGNVDNLVNGNLIAGATNSWTFGASWSGTYIRFDFGGGNEKVIDGFRWSTNDSSLNSGTWKLQGSNDALGWTDLSGTITLGGYYDTFYPFTNTTAYRYYQLVPVSYTAAAQANVEIDFKLKDGDPPAPPGGTSQIVLITAISG